MAKLIEERSWFDDEGRREIIRLVQTKEDGYLVFVKYACSDSDSFRPVNDSWPAHVRFDRGRGKLLFFELCGLRRSMTPVGALHLLALEAPDGGTAE